MNTSLFPVVILAGGLATRLRPVTETIPKALITIHGEPFIAHQLRLLKNENIQRVVICLGYLGEQIIDFVGSGQSFGLEINYSWDGNSLLGTAGAIKKALPLLDDYFFVLYGDSYLRCSYQDIQDFFLQKKSLALMTVLHNQGQWDSSNVEFFNGEIIAYDKQNKTHRMHYIDYGLSLLSRSIFNDVPDQTAYDLALLYQQLVQQKKLAAFKVTERFYEVGSFAGIQELNEYFKQKELACNSSNNF